MPLDPPSPSLGSAGRVCVSGCHHGCEIQGGGAGRGKVQGVEERGPCVGGRANPHPRLVPPRPSTRRQPTPRTERTRARAPLWSGVLPCSPSEGRGLTGRGAGLCCCLLISEPRPTGESPPYKGRATFYQFERAREGGVDASDGCRARAGDRSGWQARWGCVERRQPGVSRVPVTNGGERQEWAGDLQVYTMSVRLRRRRAVEGEEGLK